MAARVDIDLCEELAQQAASGDAQACQKLIEILWPHWLDLVRTSRHMGSLGKSDDHVYNVATALVAKFGDRQGRALKSYPSWRDANAGKDFGDWVRIVTANAVRAYLREQLGARGSLSDAPSLKRMLNEYMMAPALEEPGVRPPMTRDQTVRELVEFAKTKLPTNQVRALALWLEGSSFEDIEHQLKLPAGQGNRLLRAAVAVLRRHFKGTFEEIDMGPA